MQISFFVCNEAAAEEFIYLDVLFEKRELTPQETKEEKTEGFYITAELFSLKEDIRISFQVRGKDIFFQKAIFACISFGKMERKSSRNVMGNGHRPYFAL